MASRIKLTLTHRLIIGFQYLTLILASIFVMLPLWSVFAGSFKRPAEYLASQRIAPPESFLNFDNYREVLFPTVPNGIGLIGAFGNTILVLLVSLVFLILLGTAAGYVLARFRFRGRLIILGAYAALVVIPGILTPISTFQVLSFLGVANSKWALVVLYSGADIVSLMILIQFVRSIPEEIDESARIEGAGYFTIFRRLILPMMMPAIATVIILRSVGIYNDFVAPFLYAANPADQTVSMMLYSFAGYNSGKTEAVLLAAVVLVILPTLVAFFFLQRFIYAGITQGAVKG